MASKAAPAMLAVFGKAKGGSEPPEAESAAEDSAEGVPEDFEDYAATAFPELADDPARLRALYDAINACK